jgi:hypothetical protein
MQYSQNKSESEIDGDVLDASATLRTALGDFITRTTGAGLIKRQGTTLKIAIPFTTNAMLSGKPISTVIIKLGKSSSSDKKPTKRLNDVHARSSTSVRSNKRKSSKN